MRDDTSPVNRRQFLAASTAGVTALLAGCSSSSGKNNSNNSTKTTPPITTVGGPEQYARVSLTGPSNVTIGESFRLTLHVTNVGGESGMITSQLTITEGPRTLTRTLESESIAPGESVSVRTKPIQLNRADTYVFTIEQSDFTHAVTVHPKTSTLGSSFDVTDNLRATVKDVSFQPAEFYTVDTSNGKQTRLQSVPNGSLLAILHVGLENIGAKPTSVTADSFQVPTGQMVSTLGNGTPLTAAQIQGKPLTTLQLAPAEQRERWLLAHVPRSEARNPLAIVYQRDAAGTPPEFRWIAAPNGGKRTFPQFSVKQFHLPKSAEAGTDATATVAVTNTGKETATFRGMVEYRFGDDGDWQPVRPIKVRIQAGKTARKQFTINSTSAGSATYRIAPLGATETIEYTPPVLPFGNTYESKMGVNVTLSDLQATDSVVVKNSGVPKYRVTAPSGKRFVLVQVRSITVGESESTPQIDEFFLSNGSKVFERADDVSFPLVSPVDGPLYDGVLNPEIGSTRKGYLVYTVPKQVALDDLTVQWTSYLSEEVWWTKGGKVRSR